MKKMFIIFVSLFILTSCEIFHAKNFYYYYTGVDVGPYYTEEGNYFYSDYPYIYEIKNDNAIVKYENIELFGEDNIIYFLKDGVKKEVGYLNKDEIEFNKYDVREGWNNGPYYTVKYDGNELMKFSPHSLEYGVIYENCLLNDKLYFIVMHWKDGLKGKAGCEWDDNYINTILYCVDIKNKVSKVIYSSDSNYAIVHGNDQFVYLIDKNNSIYQYDLNNGKYTLFYETDYVGGIAVIYRHNKLFIFDNHVHTIDVND